MKLFKYVLDTKGGTDWTEEHVILARSRAEADGFFEQMKAKGSIPHESRFTELLDIEEKEIEVPCFLPSWRNDY